VKAAFDSIAIISFKYRAVFQLFLFFIFKSGLVLDKTAAECRRSDNPPKTLSLLFKPPLTLAEVFLVHHGGSESTSASVTVANTRGCHPEAIGHHGQTKTDTVSCAGDGPAKGKGDTLPILVWRKRK